MRAPSYESPESASPRITRAVAAALHRREFKAFRFPWWQKLALTILNAGPRSLARAAARWDVGRRAHDPALAERLKVEDLAIGRLADYQRLTGEFPAVVLGSALGGPAAHLAAALGGPFLPQPFVLNFKGGSPKDEVEPHFERSRALGERILANNADIMVIGHFDPVHDGWLTSQVNHVRIKLLRTPPAYTDFLRARLRKGGVIVYLDCRAEWPQYQIGKDHVYQIGGWGGIDPQDFLAGNAAIDAYLERKGSPHRGGWRVSGLPLKHGRESEWGSEPGLDADLAAFARRAGFRFLRLTFDRPSALARFTYHVYEHLLERNGLTPQGVLVEMFTQYDPSSVLAGGLLPLWLVFNTRDSLAVLQEMRACFPEDRPVFFSALATLSRTPDMVPWEGWTEALQGLDWRSIGASETRYPEDLKALWRWQTPLRKWVQAHPAPECSLLPAEELCRVADQSAVEVDG